ncbi:MAG: hypothetical protein K8H88_04905, partial [Sandaracinaceae bacterium]|nr:hypothetical protein [Sandaracinaceae bacterium]
SLRHPCSEVRLGNVGVDVIRWVGGQPSIGTAILSGVRGLAIEQGTLWASIRDDAPGLACDGIGTQGGLFLVHDDRGGVAAPLRAVAGDGDLDAWRPARNAPTHIALRSPTRRAVAGWRENVFVGADDGAVFNPTSEFGTSLWPLALVWRDDTHLWIGGRATHSAGDPPNLADVGPRGVALVELNESGRVVGHTRFVREWREPEASTVRGLPSAEVTDVITLGSTTYVLCGAERTRAGSLDRLEGEVFTVDGVERLGGIARIDERGAITILAGSGVAPDPRAGALDAEGNLWVLDAREGALRWDGSVFEPVAIDLIQQDSLPTALTIDGDAMIASYAGGAYVRLGGREAWIDGVGFAWESIVR